MTLRINSRGSQVAKLQAELKAAGISPGAIDGAFGRGTLAAVKKYQAKHHLRADGVVGPKTWHALLTDGKKPGSTGRTTAPAPAAPRGSLVNGYVNGVPRKIRIAPIGNGKQMRADAAARYNQMKAAARRVGISLTPVSGFRTMAQQRALYAAYRAGRGNLAARPGYSNHQGGLSVDIKTGSYSSATYKWLARHGRQYGFVNDVRGEPWHWTFRG
jgi:peptidoglycan hydrolase-like protein with peptidoglycan-binding domain